MDAGELAIVQAVVGILPGECDQNRARLLGIALAQASQSSRQSVAAPVTLSSQRQIP